MVGRVVNRIVNLRTLLIVTYRPEFRPPWIGQPHVSTLTINRLTRPETSAMIERVAGNTLIPPNIQQDIAERTDGIPLFVEEITKAVMEANSQRATELPEGQSPDSIGHKVSVFSALAVPASLHASLTARLDRLGSAKEIAQIGSVIGREFSYALMAAVARKSEAELQLSLNHLVAAGLLFRQGLPPYANYLFKHALVQNAAYGTLLREPTRALHAQIADVYERQFHDLVETRPELLADHLARAGSAERAIGFYLKAARAATGKGAVAEAVAQLHRGLALLGKIANAEARQRHEIELQITLGNALMASRGFSSAETDAAFRRAAELCRAADDKAQSVRVLWGQSILPAAGSVRPWPSLRNFWPYRNRSAMPAANRWAMPVSAPVCCTWDLLRTPAHRLSGRSPPTAGVNTSGVSVTACPGASSRWRMGASICCCSVFRTGHND